MKYNILYNVYLLESVSRKKKGKKNVLIEQLFSLRSSSQKNRLSSLSTGAQLFGRVTICRYKTDGIGTVSKMFRQHSNFCRRYFIFQSFLCSVVCLRARSCPSFYLCNEVAPILVLLHFSL